MALKYANWCEFFALFQLSYVNKGVLTLGNLHHAWAHLTPKGHSLLLVRSQRTVCGHS